MSVSVDLKRCQMLVENIDIDQLVHWQQEIDNKFSVLLFKSFLLGCSDEMVVGEMKII